MESEKTKKKDFRHWLNGSWLEPVLLHLRLIIFITILVFVYIYNRYAHERKIREVSKLRTELYTSKIKSLCVSEELMLLTKQTKIFSRLNEMGSELIEPIKPPTVIELDD